MHYLGLALYAEGRTDDRFLSPVLQRLCGDICSSDSRHLVEINDEVLILQHSRGMSEAHLDERILDAAMQARGAWSILFVHADADGDAVKARRERVQPGLDRLRKEFGQDGQGVAVIPIQETEAWALCDGDAIRSVFGSTLDDKALGLPVSVAAIERLADPKQCLEDAFRASRSAGRRRTQFRRASDTLSAIGEHVALQRLRQLPAFKALESELRCALREVRILD